MEKSTTENDKLMEPLNGLPEEDLSLLAYLYRRCRPCTYVCVRGGGERKWFIAREKKTFSNVHGTPEYMFTARRDASPKY